MFPNTVTLFHYEDDEYTKLKPFKKCFCYQDKKARLNKNGITYTDKLTVIIDTSNDIKINEGFDMIVKGECSFNFDNSDEESKVNSLKELKSKYEVYTVSGVDNNLYGDLPNIVLHCE